jgi:EmrB/QacA subfamily drug resistance transporter
MLSISNSVTMLITFRILQGIGSAMIFGTSIAMLTSVFPIGDRGKALGITVAAVYSGLSLGPLLGGFLTQNFGWRSIFLVNIPIGLIIIVTVFLKLKEEWTEAKGEKFDFIGSIIYGVSLLLIMYGISLIPDLLGGFLIGMGSMGLLIFIKWEMKSKNPVLEINLFRNNTIFAFSNFAALIHYSATFAVVFLLSLYLQYIKGLMPLNAGIFLISQPIMMATFSPISGWLSDKIEPRIVASIGMALTTFGLFFLIFLDEKTTFESIVISLVLLGVGFALFSSPNTNAIMSSVEKKYYGIASGTLGTMRLTGQMLSMGVAMLLFAIYIGRVQITPEFFPLFLVSVNVAFTIFTILCFIGIFASLKRGKIR